VELDAAIEAVLAEEVASGPALPSERATLLETHIDQVAEAIVQKVRRSTLGNDPADRKSTNMVLAADYLNVLEERIAAPVETVAPGSHRASLPRASVQIATKSCLY